MHYAKPNACIGRTERSLQCTKATLTPQSTNVFTHPYSHVHWKPPFEHWPRLVRNPRPHTLSFAPRASPFSTSRAKHQTELLTLIRHCLNVISQCRFAMFSDSFLDLF